MENIVAFNEKHDLNTENQFKQLVEEVAEVSSALHQNKGEDRVASEASDVAFVALSIIDLNTDADTEMLDVVRETAAENIAKNTSTEGDKVTKE